MKPRGMLIANPNATSTTTRMRDVITRALGSELDLEVVTTTHRGHAEELAADSSALDVLITLGGDGTINEAVNGMLDGPGVHHPMLAAIPGGAANVMARALGFPNDAIEATGMILEALRTGTSHWIGLGHAQFAPSDDSDVRGHWFTINAGFGLDADVIEAMEAQRAKGHAATPTRYAWTATREFLADQERRRPRLRLEPATGPIVEGLALVIVQNTAPWTYFGSVPINACPRASFDLGLDVFAPHSLGLLSTARFGSRMLRGSKAGSVPGRLLALHDQPELTVRATAPTNLQLDGDAMGKVDWVRFRSVPRALQIVG